MPVPVNEHWRIDLSQIDPADAAEHACLVNTPGNPAGGIDDLGAAAAWGRASVPVFSDECYIEFTWDGPPRSILEHGSDSAIAVRSLFEAIESRWRFARVLRWRPELVHCTCPKLRKHAGFMVPGPVQAAAIVSFGDQEHVEVQKARYLERAAADGAEARRQSRRRRRPAWRWVHLWAPAPEGDAWGFAGLLARGEAGVLVSPGEFYGDAGAGHVRIAVVQPTERLQLALDRLAD
ncbi:MAG: hypothetical protein R2710_13095 [Acidimicrobiales bacterium]